MLLPVFYQLEINWTTYRLWFPFWLSAPLPYSAGAPDVDVVDQDVVEVAALLVAEECVGHPHLHRVASKTTIWILLNIVGRMKIQ